MKRGGSSSSKKSRLATGEESGGSSRPYYECHFCKHGFTTAQALGGHMNIHRRDRTRRPGCDDTPATGTASAAYPRAPPMGGSFATYYDSAGAYAASDAVGFAGASQTEPNLFGAAATHGHDLHLGLGSRVPEEWGRPDGEAERSLDLELRLGVGRHPGWQ